LLKKRYKSAGYGTVDTEKLYTLEFENELFAHFGTKYTLKLDGLDDQNGFLIHFPSLIQIAKDHKLKMLDISNFHQFYDDRKYVLMLRLVVLSYHYLFLFGN
jgi:hypothetical protein